MSTAVTVSNNAARRRYEATLDEAAAGFLNYQETDELVVLTHTEVDASFEGRGVGSALARHALDDIRERGLKALVICPFVLGWMRHHREYADVLYNAPRPTVSAQEQQS